MTDIDTKDWLIVGLGNPGKQYEGTRHNIGKEVVQKLKNTDELSNFKVITLIPNTYMNLSGGEVAKVMGKDKIERSNNAHKLIVIHDDIDLPVGTIKITFGKNSGGQKGVESIIKAIGTKDFVRVRIGIAPVTFGKMRKPPKDRISSFVLKPFGVLERQKVNTAITKATEAIETLIREGIQVAMNKYN